MVSQFNRIIFFCAAILVKEMSSGRNCLSGDISLPQCPQNQTCVPNDLNHNEAFCECSPGFVKISNELCLNTFNATDFRSTAKTPIQDSADSNINGVGEVGQSAGRFVVISLLSCIFIIFVICIILYFNYRHRFLNRLWLKINQRRGNYDEVLIGQTIDDDDPPLV